MPHVYAAVDTISGKPRVGSGTCVDIVKMLVPGLLGKPTSAWKEGVSVMEAHRAGKPILRGTAIATFKNGRYPQSCSPGYQGSCHHAALVMSVQNGGIWVLDQYTDPKRPNMTPRFIRIPPPSERTLPDGSWRNAGNNALAFSVIE